MRILLTGARGQVGRALTQTLAPVGDLIATDRNSLDLADEHAIRDAVRSLRPDLVINAAAYTAVDAAETDEATARWLNADVPRVLAEESARAGALLVHYSTDYVFDGRSERPYREDDPTSPLNVYGQTKLAGEHAVQAAGGAHLIFRIAWVYAREGRNFLVTMLRLARERRELRVVDDQVGPPTWAQAVAEATAAIVGQHPAPSASGIYHLAPPDGCSWHAFATAILEQDPRRAEHIAEPITAIPSTAYPTPARRPANSLLDSSRAARVFGIRLAPWQEQLMACLSDKTTVATVAGKKG